MKLSTVINTIRTVRTSGFQAAVNNLSDGYLDPEFFPIVETKHGDKFYREHANDVINTFDHYSSLEKITRDDIVFDIGAFIGGFTIPAAKRAKRVYAMEPLYGSELLKNVGLNRLLHNVFITTAALGDLQGGTELVSYFKTDYVITTTFRGFIEDIGESPTYLKCNCEGAEWFLKPSDFAGINTIEIQFHYSPNFADNPSLLFWLRDNYQCMESTEKTQGVNGIYMVRDLHGVKL